MKFLYETLIEQFGKLNIEKVEIPKSISENLKFEIRPYQSEAFKRFLCFNQENFSGKQNMPHHLLFNMATGSGKTLIMAGLILHLYKKGYRDFIFFVNSTNIIQKTKENFLNPFSLKYLFQDKIIIEGKEVFIKELQNFDESDEQNINIKFTTIQQLHIDLTRTKENSITYEDLQNKKMVLIADEAHHLSSSTKKQSPQKEELLDSWENTVLKILETNFENILLEFTATLDYTNESIKDKYIDKVIFKYDLAQFREDKYSKEINLIYTLYDEKERILQALLLNLYRQELAALHNINLKPVILFKAKRTIYESQENKKKIHALIDSLSESAIEHIKKTSTVPIVQKAFAFFEAQKISSGEIVRRLQSAFKPENCISANDEAESEKNQILLNTLEDENNPIRAVFAVQKLNEGWDVLNLFDIVRLYEDRDSKDGKPGKTTIAEAQLIGRGARYFPFQVNHEQDKFTRKYDDDIGSDLKILEELYYHTKEDSRYISELKKALVDSGIYGDDKNLVTKQLQLKSDFKETNFYKEGQVFFNTKTKKNFSRVHSFDDLGLNKKNFRYKLSSGDGHVSRAFDKNKESKSDNLPAKDIKLSKIPAHVIRYALSCNPFFYFSNFIKYFPNINSTFDFIQKQEYLGGLEITFQGTEKRLNQISNEDYLKAILSSLSNIESVIKSNVSEYEGGAYTNDFICKVFTDKEIRVKKNDERADGDAEFVKDKSWYVYNANYGTKEEKSFVEMFAGKFESIKEKYENIYLIRNERFLKIFNKDGNAFEPDFLLFCKQKSKKSNEQLIYQVFIEPKGNHLVEHDKWKEKFLEKIRNEKKIIHLTTDKYKITGVPFYNSDNENEFKKSLEDVLEIQN